MRKVLVNTRLFNRKDLAALYWAKNQLEVLGVKLSVDDVTNYVIDPADEDCDGYEVYEVFTLDDHNNLRRLNNAEQRTEAWGR